MAEAWKLRGYVIEQLLGRGASSEVWRARVAGSGEPVALKRLFGGGDRPAAAQAVRARAEGAVLTVLDHPNLVRLHDVVPTDESAVLVLDLADGGSLADLLAVRGRLTPGEVITAVAPVAAALAYVHRHGVVHGDVSSANILFTAGGVALLADLGVARLTGDRSAVESTPAYVDPAVAAGSVPAPSSDVFMLGAVALHALTGAPLWPGRDAAAALAVARGGAALMRFAGERPHQDLGGRGGDVGDVAARLSRAGVPAATAEVLVRALASEPHQRCTAAALALDLRHSGTPTAVELSAGRQREAPDDPGPGGHGRTSPHAGSYGPRHAAPPAPDGVGGAAPPTHAVARPRPVLPPRRAVPGWRRVVPGVRTVGVLTAAALLVAVAVAVGVGWLGRNGHASADRAASPRPAVSRPTAATTAAPTPTPTRTVTHRPTAAERWVRALRSLDARRGRAFAVRDVALLRRVYAPGALLRADTALLGRLVPAGCGLSGARTGYDRLRVQAHAGRAVVRARARIPASILHCPGRPDRRAAAVGPTRVRIELADTADGPRIVRQWR